MGIYFNPDNGSFRQSVGSRIYVDKTGLLSELNMVLGSEEKCVAVSHARRFGKSQAAGMIDAYYSIGSDSEELFSKYEIAREDNFKKHLNKYNVIHWDIASVADFHKEDLVDECIKRFYDDVKVVYGDQIDYSKDINLVIHDIYNLSKLKFVIVIDEWDCVVRNHADRPDLVHAYFQFLHAMFKSEESKSYLALAYITGILPIKKIEDESALNNFREYTMLESDQLTRYFGFTEDEILKLCKEYDAPYESVKEWYNGYLISGIHMYNPNSVYEALVRRRMDSYWKNTSSFKTINTLIGMNMQGLKEDILSLLSGNQVEVDITTFQNDLSVIDTKDEALTALIHLGYLAYDSESGGAYIPNYEVATAYKSALKNSSWDVISKAISRCDEILRATIRKDAERVAEILEQAHDAYTSILKYNDENSLSCAITMAYFTAPSYYNVVRELPSGKGFADIAMIPRADSKGKPAIIVELKWNKDVDTAIEQIKDRRYAGCLKGYSDEILLVGISYNKNSENKKHECIIESVKL